MAELFRYIQQAFVVPSVRPAIDVARRSDLQDRLRAAISQGLPAERLRSIADGFLVQHFASPLDDPTHLGKQLLSFSGQIAMPAQRIDTARSPVRAKEARFLYAVLAVLATLGTTVLGQDRIENASAGLTLDKPSGWQTASAADIQANRERVRLPDAEFQRALVTRSALPIVALMKYPEPYESLNPSIQITLRQALRGTPTKLLTDALTTMRRGFPDLSIVTPVAPANVSGLAAAHVRVTYTLRTANRAVPVLSRIWLVPRGSLMFLIGMSGAQSGPDVCEPEFAAVLRSIRIEH